MNPSLLQDFLLVSASASETHYILELVRESEKNNQLTNHKLGTGSIRLELIEGIAKQIHRITIFRPYLIQKHIVAQVEGTEAHENKHQRMQNILCST